MTNESYAKKEQKIDSVLESIQQIQKRLDAAPVLNGGFAKLMSSVEQMQKEQERIGKKYDELDETLYAPDKGYFARITKTEGVVEELDNSVTQIKTEVKRASTTLKTQQQLLDSNVKELDKIKTAAGGDSYQTLTALSQMKTRVDKFSWLLAAAIISPLLQFIWHLLTKK